MLSLHVDDSSPPPISTSLLAPLTTIPVLVSSSGGRQPSLPGLHGLFLTVLAIIQTLTELFVPEALRLHPTATMPSSRLSNTLLFETVASTLLPDPLAAPPTISIPSPPKLASSSALCLLLFTVLPSTRAVTVLPPASVSSPGFKFPLTKMPARLLSVIVLFVRVASTLLPGVIPLPGPMPPET